MPFDYRRTGLGRTDYRRSGAGDQVVPPTPPPPEVPAGDKLLSTKIRESAGQVYITVKYRVRSGGAGQLTIGRG